MMDPHIIKGINKGIDKKARLILQTEEGLKNIISGSLRLREKN